MPTHTSEYFQYTKNDSLQSVYYTFTPKPITGGNHYAIDEELSSLLIETHRALGILEGMTIYMPDKEILRDIMLLKESSFSIQIDCLDFDFYSALEKRGCGKDIGVEQNIMSAYISAFRMGNGINMLSDICSIALYGSDSSERTSIRTNQMLITDMFSNMKRYNPTAPTHIHLALTDMLKYLENDTSDILVKAALVHYQFEMIHPFECYNGVVGRILTSMILRNIYSNATDYLCISKALFNAKNDYFDILTATQKHGGYLLWIKFFVRQILESARHSTEQIRQCHEIIRCDEARIDTHPTSTANTRDIYSFYKKYLVSGVKHPAVHLQLAYTTSQNAVKILQDLDILRQTSSGARNKCFVYHELVEILVGKI